MVRAPKVDRVQPAQSVIPICPQSNTSDRTPGFHRNELHSVPGWIMPARRVLGTASYSDGQT
jgi:hypothetical protein